MIFTLLCAAGTVALGLTHNLTSTSAYGGKTSVNYKSCEFKNVCYDKGTWKYFAKQEDTQATTEKLVNVGTYESSPVFKFDAIGTAV